MLKKMGVESKFSMTATLGIVALLVAGICVMLILKFVKDDWDSMNSESQMKKIQIVEMRSQIGYGGSIHSNFVNYTFSGKEKDLEAFLNEINKMVIIMESYRVVGSLTEAEKVSLKAMTNSLEKYRNEAYRAQQLWEKEGMTGSEREGFSIRNNTRLVNITSLLRDLDRSGLKQPSAFKNRVGQLMAFMGGIFLALILMVAVFGFKIMRSIVKPLGDSVQKLNKVASGNLIDRVEMSSRDEITQMANSVNQAVNRMCSMMSPLDHKSGVPSNIPETLGWISQQVNGYSHRTSDPHFQMMDMEEEESEEAEESDASQEESTASSKSSKGSSPFQEVANEVKKLANDTIQATDDISKEIEEIHQNTKGTIRAITQVTSVIGKVNHRYSKIQQ